MKLTIIGAGRMGEALARGIVDAGLVTPGNLVLSDITGERVSALATAMGATASADNSAAVRAAAVVILAVKPKDIPTVCSEIATDLTPSTIVLSVAAGVTLRQLSSALGRDDVSLVRAMPNTPCLVGAGAIAMSFRDGVPAEARQTVSRLLTPLGLVEEVPESMLDAVTGLSGSGPAYIAVLIEAMADGGVLMGLPRALAQQFAAQTVMGAAKLILETGQHPAQVKDAVSSPGGTTIAGLAELEAAGFRAAAIAAVKAATQRSRELSGE